jgi:uncharacterized alkaline shock family protein YloU
VSYVIPEPNGTITVTPPALAGLVTRAAEAVNGAQIRRGRRRVDVDVTDRSVHVRLELTAQYGIVLPDLAREVQARVTDALTRMCGLQVEAVDVSVEEIE